MSGNLVPILFYGLFVAAGIAAALKTHIHTQALLTLSACFVLLVVYFGIRSQNGAGDAGVDNALALLFLVMFPCGIFIPVMWLTSSIKLLYQHYKGPGK